MDIWNVVLVVCSLFLLSLAGSVCLHYRNNPYRGERFFIDKNEPNSPLYISKSTMVDGKGNPIPKYKRVSCVPNQKYTRATSEWFYNNFEGSTLIDFVPIKEEEATLIYMKHRKFTNEVKSRLG